MSSLLAVSQSSSSQSYASRMIGQISPIEETLGGLLALSTLECSKKTPVKLRKFQKILENAFIDNIEKYYYRAVKTGVPLKAEVIKLGAIGAKTFTPNSIKAERSQDVSGGLPGIVQGSDSTTFSIEFNPSQHVGEFGNQCASIACRPSKKEEDAKRYISYLKKYPYGNQFFTQLFDQIIKNNQAKIAFMSKKEIKNTARKVNYQLFKVLKAELGRKELDYSATMFEYLMKKTQKAF